MKAEVLEDDDWGYHDDSGDSDYDPMNDVDEDRRTKKRKISPLEQPRSTANIEGEFVLYLYWPTYCQTSNTVMPTSTVFRP